MNAPLLQVEQLDCVVRQAGVLTGDADLAVLQQLDFSLQRGRILGLVGESGCGKSMTGNAILGLLEPPARIVRGRILFDGVDLLQQDEAALRGLRGDRIAMVFQDPMAALNPREDGMPVSPASTAPSSCEAMPCCARSIEVADTQGWNSCS